jgi:phage shock protein PspC (stress-responsive transcriptional regulator)
MKRLYRSVTDKKIAGVCGGIAELLNVDPTIIRVLFVFAGLATGIFPFVIGYIIAWFIVPVGSQPNAEN